MSLEQNIEAKCRNWGRKLSQDLHKSLNDVLGNVQDSKIQFNEVISVSKDGVSVQIIASDEYWMYIESGRKPGSKPPPSDVVGLKWQGSRGIQPKRVLAEIELKRKKRLSTIDRRLSKTTKELSTQEASKRLSFIIARSIGKKGIEPKPFVEKVVTNERLNELASMISLEYGRDFEASLTFKESTIKIEL
jgi:hypothetical protein